MTAEDTKHHAPAIYIDVELSCWIGPPPVGMKEEIIEIGLVEMDLSYDHPEKAHFVRGQRGGRSAVDALI